MNKLKKTEGITLVALVITIIVLVILVGVTLNTITNTGLIPNTKTAVELWDQRQTEEEAYIAEIEAKIRGNIEGESYVDIPSDIQGKVLKYEIYGNSNEDRNTICRRFN